MTSEEPMYKAKARDICQLDADAIWDIKPGRYLLEFDDGVVETNDREIHFGYYFWWPFRQWPNTPFKKEHFLTERLNKNTVLTLMGKSAYDALEHDPSIDPELLGAQIKDAITALYKDLANKLEPFVTSLNALDYLQIIDHPTIKEVNNNLKALDLTKRGVLANSEIYIREGQEKVRGVLTNNSELDGNRLYEVTRTKQVDQNQALQQTCALGHRSDIDSSIRPRPIMVGYVEGLKRLADSALDSRSAAKALLFTHHPLQDTEYMNREMQMLTANLTTLHADDDCGTEHFMPWPLTEGNFQTTLGMTFKLGNEELSEQRPLSVTDRDLIGKVIYVRNALTCEHDDPYGICGECFGKLRRQVPRYTNIGHASVTELCADMSQNVLSVKHLDGTAVTGEIFINENDRRYIVANQAEQSIRLNPAIGGYKLKLRVPEEGVQNLADIHYDNTSIARISPQTISAMEYVTLVITDNDGDSDMIPLKISSGSKKPYFRRKFLEYIKKRSYKLESDKHIVIELDEWDVEEPIWEMPRRHANMLEFLRNVKGNLKGTRVGTRSRLGADMYDMDTHTDAILELSEMVSTKFKIHMTHLAVILKSTMATDPKEGNYHIPTRVGEGQYEQFKKLMVNRSLVPIAAYQELQDVIYSPEAFINTNRPAHPYDDILMGDD